MRSFILQNFERALISTDEEEKSRLMNFLIVGGGPTGVEIAGSLAELKRHVLPHDYPELDLSNMKITILEAGNNVLDVMSDSSKRNSKKQLEELGIHLLMGRILVTYDGLRAVLKDGTVIATSALIWTAGVKGNIPPGFSPDLIVRGNRLTVDVYNRVMGFEHIFAIGDIAAMQPETQPMLAPVAMQQGKNLAKNLNIDGPEKWNPFQYSDNGTMATIGRSRAVADLKGGLHLKGFLAWLAWLFIHLMLVVGFRNKVVVLFNWLWNYFSYDRAIRLIIRPYKKKNQSDGIPE
jgi:NADH dehydrogenase